MDNTRENRKNDPVRRARYLFQLRDAELKRNFGFGVETFREMEANQDGRCFICGERPEKSLLVDHCHESGKVRGLLCRKCNSGIGMLKDSPKLLRIALEYLSLKELPMFNMPDPKQISYVYAAIQWLVKAMQVIAVKMGVELDPPPSQES